MNKPKFPIVEIAVPASEPLPETFSAINIKDRILQSLTVFEGHKSNAQTKAAVVNTVKSILHSYLAGGLIYEIPLIDLNHEQELAYLKKKFDEIQLKLINADTLAELNELHNQQATIYYRINGLEAQLSTDPRCVEVFFKEHGTFAPYAWKRTPYE